jgi:hypothetical protein
MNNEYEFIFLNFLNFLSILGKIVKIDFTLFLNNLVII